MPLHCDADTMSELVSCGLVPRPHPPIRKRVWWLLSKFLVVLRQQS